jgi:hypothetical protein
MPKAAARKSQGDIAVPFDGYDAKIANCLPIEWGWNYMVRLYHPRAEILNGTCLNGTWKYPELWPADGSGSRAPR